MFPMNHNICFCHISVQDPTLKSYIYLMVSPNVARTLQQCRWVHVRSSKNSVIFKDPDNDATTFLESPSNLGFTYSVNCRNVGKSYMLVYLSI